MEKSSSGIAPQIIETISSESMALYGKDQSTAEWNEAYITANQSSAPHVQAGLKIRGLLDKNTRDQNEKELIETLSIQGETLSEAGTGLGLLEEWRSSAEVVAAYKQAAGSIWTEATAFKTN